MALLVIVSSNMMRVRVRHRCREIDEQSPSPVNDPPSPIAS